MEVVGEIASFSLKFALVAIVLSWIALLFMRAMRIGQAPEKRIVVRNYRDWLRTFRLPLSFAALSPVERKTMLVQDRAELKRRRAQKTSATPRLWVLSFKGDMNAGEVADLKDEITAVLGAARPNDEVLARIESSGGTVVGYGLGAAHLERIRAAGLRLTAAVDKVAASGGYMMAAVADEIIAAPYAIVGSIGVIATVPNIRPLLDEKGVRVLEVTAGEYKRTITPFSEVTPERLAKLEDQLSDVHTLFKSHIAKHRPQVDIEQVATGEYWYGAHALERKLVDQLTTSDDWLIQRVERYEIFLVRTVHPGRKVMQQVERMVSATIDRVVRAKTPSTDVTDIHRI